MKIVELDWIDAWHTSGEMTITEASELKPMKRRSVGYLISHEDTVYILASGFIERYKDGEDSYCDFDIIPASFVTHVRER